VRRTVEKYSYEDGRADRPSAFVSVFADVGPGPVARADVEVAFAPAGFALTVRTAAAEHSLRVPALYAAIAPEACRWSLRRVRGRAEVVLRLAKAEPRKKWYGLARGANAVAKEDTGTRDFITQKLFGVKLPSEDDAEVIKTVDDRPRYTGPPTYEWNDDDQYRDLEQKLLAQKRRAKLLAGRG